MPSGFIHQLDAGMHPDNHKQTTDGTKNKRQ